jgi:hypothetical protein
MDDLDASLQALLVEHRATWADVEPLITDGYARVLRLEAERLRVMRELVDLASNHNTADQAAMLGTELDGIGHELSTLRASLHAVRRRFVRDGDLLPRTAAG